MDSLLFLIKKHNNNKTAGYTLKNAGLRPLGKGVGLF